MLYDTIPLNHSDTSSLYLIPILQSSETAPGSRMALQPHPRSPVPQSLARGSALTLTGHQPLGSDDYPSINEGRGTPHEPTEGLDPSSCRSDHSNPFHTGTRVGDSGRCAGGRLTVVPPLSRLRAQLENRALLVSWWVCRAGFEKVKPPPAQTRAFVGENELGPRRIWVPRIPLKTYIHAGPCSCL